jgi:hypothetical protein
MGSKWFHSARDTRKGHCALKTTEEKEKKRNKEKEKKEKTQALGLLVLLSCIPYRTST